MAFQQALRAPNLKNNPRKSPALKPLTMRGTNDEHRQTILDRRIKNPQNTGPEAWEIALDKERRKLIRQIIYKYHLDRIVHKSYRADVERIVIYSLYNSARTWDKSKGEFSTHAIKCGRECVYWVNLLKSQIWVNSGYSTEAFNFLSMKAHHPELTFGEFAKQREFSAEKARSVRYALLAIRANSLPLSMDAIPGENRGFADEGGEFSRLSRPRGGEAAFCNPADLHSHSEMRMDLGNVAKRVEEISVEVLGERNARILLLHYGVGTDDGEERTYTEIASMFGISRARAQNIGKHSEEKLANSIYAGELREHLGALAQYSSRLR